MQKNILWIEEEADGNTIEFITYFGAYYLIDIAPSATEAEKHLINGNYSLIILDIRIIPGDDEKWINLHLSNEKRLGLPLLKYITSKDEALKKKIVIFTNENFLDIKDDLSQCGIDETRFLRKRDIKVPEDFEDFIRKILDFS